VLGLQSVDVELLLGACAALLGESRGGPMLPNLRSK
jgi:hypothetical protein